MGQHGKKLLSCYPGPPFHTHLSLQGSRPPERSYTVPVMYRYHVRSASWLPSLSQGTYAPPKGEERVVMKRVKARVEGADEMQQMELALNVYAAKAAKGHCADFIGYCTVSDKEATPSLTAGLWLVSGPGWEGGVYLREWMS